MASKGMGTAPKKAARRKKPAAAKVVGAELVSAEELAAEALGLPLNGRGEFVPINTMIQYQQFVAAFLATGNATQAARDAGFTAPNDNAMRQLASRLMSNIHVREMLAVQYPALLAKLQVTPERIWQEITYMAFLDPAAFYNPDGSVKLMHEIAPEARRALTGYDIEERTFGDSGTVVTYKTRYNNKADGLERLMKLLGMLNDDKLVVLTGDEFMQALEAGRNRVAQPVSPIVAKAKEQLAREQRTS